jgi:bacillolysin
MANPRAFSDPDRYLGLAFWKPATNACNPIGPGNPGNNDYCGVHTNSGVQNRMFYLLSVGGSGWTNDSSSYYNAPSFTNPYQWSVGGITIDKAARIAYRVMSVYLSSNSNYFDSRNAWVHAAEDLYGVCSYEAIQTGKAWYAVGIGPPFGANNLLTCNIYGANAAFTYAKAGPVFTTLNCNTTISTSGNPVVFKSGNKVVLRPGFSSLNGSKFHSFIDDCGFATY